MSEVHVFFNVIHLPEDKVEESLEAWKAVGTYMEKQKGFLGSTLFRNRRDPLMFINCGKYETQELFMASVQNEEFQALSQKLTDLGVERTAGLYDAIHTFGELPPTV